HILSFHYILSSLDAVLLLFFYLLIGRTSSSTLFPYTTLFRSTLSEMLKPLNIPHQVLNARYHEQEAMIIAQAGVPGGATIATNMAGRGTDIQLGGNPEMRIEQELAELPEAERANRAATIRAEGAKPKEQPLAAEIG